ncbi:DUF4328 domain-containing protein [Amycolatopsis cihanbeyliensis]|uniref:Uncharacterized protein DUF4328 n=1 Tax=Amycolatopsis cihanbeyliensis TaxID=1128664 RepID=A0A542DLT2_AMYCI|nr:DUF4328 domain-containing protein [Amycolatopsis cihanbeyliensis]TQJ04052.1 uncharacterized protein DUF4328 [Amycolatopsis cihanbeyliensis]
MYPGQPPQRPRVRWVASVPPGVVPRRRAVPAGPYTGPPAYPAVPRWGFPNLTWRAPTAVPGTPSGVPHPLQRLRLLARNATTVLWTVAGLALITAGAEVWRYVLLLISRDVALSAEVVGTSDALVLAGSLLTFVMALFAIAAAAWWLFVARAAAAEEVGEDPPRPAWQVVLGTLVPGPNLALAGPIVAELEHAVLRRPATMRPRPSRLVLCWWAALVANGLLLAITVAWRFRDGVQAQADGVVLNALLDLAAATLAVLTAFLVRRLTLLLAPIEESVTGSRPWRVLKVTGAPDPERPERPATATR